MFNQKLPLLQSLPATTTVSMAKIKKVCLFKKWYRAIMGDIYATDDPKQRLPQTRKNIIIAVAGISGLSGPIGIMINLPGVPQMAQELHTSVAGMNGTVSACIGSCCRSFLFQLLLLLKKFIQNKLIHHYFFHSPSFGQV